MFHFYFVSGSAWKSLASVVIVVAAAARVATGADEMVADAAEILPAGRPITASSWRICRLALRGR